MMVCKHGCGFQADHRGTMNLHETMHCPKIKMKRIPNVITPECQHDYRLLTKAELDTVQGNYTEVCAKCLELK